MRSNDPVHSMKSIFHGLALAAALAALPAKAQESSVILKDIDALEKRVGKVEAELGRLRKMSPAAAAAGTAATVPARPDSSAAALAARLDSLQSRLKTLESRATEQDAALGNAKPPFPGSGAAASSSARDNSPASHDDEIAALVLEVKALTAQLKSGSPLTGSGSPKAAGSGEGTASKSDPKTEPKAAPKTAAEVKPVKVPALELKGDIQIQGERKFTTASNRDNLDDFWGRLNFGAEYNSEEFQSKINIRIFPEGFGFEPLTGATFDTTGQGTLKTQTQAQTRVVVNHAWVKYAAGEYRLKVGRFETLETYSDNFGNYIDLGPSGRFMSRPAVHNALEVSHAIGAGAASAMLGTGDRRLNRGFLRLYGKYPVLKNLIASGGWKANLFDRFKYEDDEILQRYDASLFWGLPGGWRTFVEAALIQHPAGREDDTPVLVGVQPFTGKVLDNLSLEAEWMPTRKVAKEYKEFLFNVHARKAYGRLKFDLGIYSDLLDAATDSFGMGLRMTSGIK